MRYRILIRSVLIVALSVLALSGAALATNGDNLISIGPISRAMGGVGIAAPQDAISAVFSNPAAMCFGPYCPGSEFNFGTTVFMPKAKTRIKADAINAMTMGMIDGDTGWKDSDSDLFFIPAVGVSMPINQNLRFGLAAYGVSGLGVDYRHKFDLVPDSFAPMFGRAAIHDQDVYTNLSIMKIAPNIAYMVTPNFSIGASFHINQGSLDMGDGDGTSSGFGFGGQIGAIYKTGPLSFGIVYVLPQTIRHADVADFDGDFHTDTLDLQSPQSLGFGIGYEPLPGQLLIEGNVKWLNWQNAKGYSDFDWKDQWVFNAGIQFKPVKQLAIRAGYNYAENPVEEHNDWNGTPPFFPGGGDTIDVQGREVPRFNYEVLRVTGFPAVVEHHVTFGIGYQVTKSLSIDLGYMHAFKKSIKEEGSFGGMPVKIESSLSEDSIDFGITWRF
ncbi:MAG: hypothetical protein OHK006_01010 [Thermodesulfovibrionales bacterium]